MKTAIRITNLRQVKFAKCEADVSLVLEAPGREDVPLVTIKEVSLRDGDQLRAQGSGKGMWLGLPARSYEGANGDKVWVKLVYLPGHTYQAALAALTEAWEGSLAAPKPYGPAAGAGPVVDDDPFSEDQ